MILDTCQATMFDIIGTACILISCLFVDLVRQRFRHLNEMIIPHVSQLPVTGSQNEITVYNVRYLHGMLLDSAEQVNTIYGLGVLLTFISLLLDLVWYIYKFIKHTQKDEDAEHIFTELLKLLIQTIYLLAMYHFTTYEVKIENFIVILFESIIRVH